MNRKVLFITALVIILSICFESVGYAAVPLFKITAETNNLNNVSQTRNLNLSQVYSSDSKQEATIATSDRFDKDIVKNIDNVYQTCQ